MFITYSCQCGSTVDLCGLHLLRCGGANPSPFTQIHNFVRDCTVRSLKDYAHRNRPASLAVVSEADSFQQCEVRHYYPITNDSDRGSRADAIVYSLDRPDLPRFIDFTQAQVNTPGPRIAAALDTAYHRKISELQATHNAVPLGDIIPFVFCPNGLIHESALLFVEWFICNAGHEHLSKAPSNEKLKILHAIQGAIVEKTASLLSVHFHRHVNTLHSSFFPHAIRRFAPDYYSPAYRRRCRRRGIVAPPPAAPGAEGLDTHAPLRSSSPGHSHPSQSSQLSNSALFDPTSSQSSLPGDPLPTSTPLHMSASSFRVAPHPTVQRPDSTRRVGSHLAPHSAGGGESTPRRANNVSAVSPAGGATHVPGRDGLRSSSTRFSVLTRFPGLQ